MKKRITNINGITDLINDLSVVYTQLREKKILRSEAKAVHLVASTLIRASVAKAMYYKNMEIDEPIPFLEN